MRGRLLCVGRRVGVANEADERKGGVLPRRAFRDATCPCRSLNQAL